MMRLIFTLLSPLILIPTSPLKSIAQLSDREIRDLGMQLDGVPGRRPTTLAAPTDHPTGAQAGLYTSQAAPERNNAVFSAVEAE